MTSSVKPEYENYGTPAALLADENLSDKEKVRLLEVWRDDEEALIRAASEGLNGGEDNALAEVLKALKKLKPEDEINNDV